MTNEEVLQLIEQAAKNRLTELDLSNNQLTELPPEIGQLTHLSRLNVRDNKLTELPPEIGQLTRLDRLYLSNNKLTELPPEIGQLTRLDRLYLSNNKLTELPPEIGQLIQITQIYLSDNKLTALPPEMAQLKSLTLLDLRKNQLPVSSEILEDNLNNPALVINSCLENKPQEKIPLNEAKMLVVGAAGAGKTSILKRLIEDEFNSQKKPTSGINIQPWQIEVNKQEIKLNIWDFGGQEFMYAIHPFLLTQQSLYLLILDGAQKKKNHEMEYWLKLIETFSPSSPIIMVANKTDQGLVTINRSSLSKKYPNIKAFVETSCLNGNGIEELRTFVHREVGALELIRNQIQLPENWLAVKEQLEQMEKGNIDNSEYQRLCEDNLITEEKDQRKLSKLLQQLGIVLNFKDIGMVKPQWLINGIYKIFNNHSSDGGILEVNEVKQILESEKYQDEYQLLLQLMGKFELGFQEEEIYIIPNLLSEEEPDLSDLQQSWAFQYQYNILPRSILARFMVRRNKEIDEENCWKNGVVLAKNATKAVIKAEKEENTITVWVSGETQEKRRNFLQSIRSEFKAIHETNPGIKAKEQIILSEHPEIRINYQDLLSLEARGEENFMPPGGETSVNVKELLDQIEAPEERREYQQDIIITEEQVKPPTQLNSGSAQIEEQNNTLKSQTSQKNLKLYYLLGLGIVTALLTIFVHWSVFPIVLILVIMFEVFNRMKSRKS